MLVPWIRLCLLYAQHKIKKNTIITATQNITEIAAHTSWPTSGDGSKELVALSDITSCRGGANNLYVYVTLKGNFTRN